MHSHKSANLLDAHLIQNPESKTHHFESMEEPRKLVRRSIYSFLQNYQYFTSIVAVLAFPYAISVLLSQALLLSSSSLLPFTFDHLRTLFDAAGFPTSSKFFSILIQKLSQTIVSSIYSLPFSLTFLLISKACVIQALNQQKPNSVPSFSSIIPLFNPLLLTHVCNVCVYVSANATVFCMLFFAFNCLEGFGYFSPNCLLLVSVFGAFLYSVAIAKAIIICNLAWVLSGMERNGGFMAILKACVLIQGRSATALLVALPFNLGMAVTEALFQYRIVRDYHSRGRLGPSMVLEGMFVAYLYSVFVVLDAIVNTMFFKSCRVGSLMGPEIKSSFCLWMSVAEKDNEGRPHLKGFEELP
ncbi:uncharacterized protein LOC111780178 isoform X1 [Cucurbita pepo subsp. pepo]|uniref:uncharacterized protein LOC111780178 isoform X1 n=2 Tax=Cucurbita pepo subsp. pepo TaxID=3664 RepID=UPI000C9D4105|nr:uncharacterized protein LOC111780178 isoform X1 [Cucurbita pepo subsp. pepo]XP_023516274.1 uncharacterized protein LOC111780178 isoform X1 [Cucurbita pepo subsp. pepo]